jgi:putative FmdB family regulatory protein
MPLYEFECTQCGHRFERILRFTDPYPEACPECGGIPKKMISASSFQFKGTGWYVTDYARKGSTPTGESEATKAESSKSESKPESKSESKPETKPESKPAETKAAATSAKSDD